MFSFVKIAKIYRGVHLHLFFCIKTCVKLNCWYHKQYVNMQCLVPYNTELNDLRKIICLRKPEVSVERISVSYVTENLAGHGIHCLPCSFNNDIINMLP